MKLSNDAKLVIGLLLILIIGVVTLSSNREQVENKATSTYNSDNNGVKAFYILLDRLGYKTSRLQLPYNKIPKKAEVLIVVQPMIKISQQEEDALADWISAGGTFICISSEPEDLPGVFEGRSSFGSGRVITFKKTNIITNKGLRNSKRAVSMVRIIDKNISNAGLVLFDEYHQGYSNDSDEIIISKQVKIAILILLAAGLVLLHTRAKRFGSVQELPEVQNSRQELEYVEAVASLYERANSTEAAAQVMCGAFKHRVCRKLMLPTDAKPADIIINLPDEIAKKAGMIFADCNSYSEGQKPGISDLIILHKSISKIEEELGIGKHK